MGPRRYSISAINVGMELDDVLATDGVYERRLRNHNLVPQMNAKLAKIPVPKTSSRPRKVKHLLSKLGARNQCHKSPEIVLAQNSRMGCS